MLNLKYLACGTGLITLILCLTVLGFTAPMPAYSQGDETPPPPLSLNANNTQESIEPDEIDFAEPSNPLVGIDPDEIDFALTPLNPGLQVQAEFPGTMPNMGFLDSTGDCSAAAMSYLAPGMLVEFKFSAVPGNFISNGSLTDNELYAYLGNVMIGLAATSMQLAPEPGETGNPVNTVPITILDDFVCRAFNSGTAMYWRVEINGLQGWMLETIRWENYEVDLGIMPDNQIDSLATQLILKDLSLHFLMPYFTPPVPADMGADEFAPNIDPVVPADLGAVDVQSAEPAPACEHGAPSYMAAGKRFWNITSSYIRLPPGTEENNPYTAWTLYPERFELDAYGEDRFQYYDEALAIESDTDIHSADQSGYLNKFIIGDIVEGPFCTNWADVTDYTGTTYSEMIGTWWRVIAFPGSGAMSEGYYLESLVGYNDYDAYFENGVDDTWERFNNVHFFYFMEDMSGFLENQSAPNTPASFKPLFNGCNCALEYKLENVIVTSLAQNSAASNVDHCEGLLTTRLSNGAINHPIALLNVREVPNGDIVSRLATGYNFWVMGEPICQDGFRWWNITNQLDGEPIGWTAENDATAYFLIPGAAPRAEDVPVEPTAIPAEPVASDSVPATSNNSDVPSSEPVPPIVEPVTDTSVPPANPTGVPGMPTDPTGGQSNPTPTRPPQ